MSRYIDTRKVTSVILTELPPQRLDPDGYTKIGGSPTDMMVEINGRKQRVMFVCFGTGSTQFIKVEGEKLLLSGTDYAELRARAESPEPGGKGRAP